MKIFILDKKTGEVSECLKSQEEISSDVDFLNEFTPAFVNSETDFESVIDVVFDPIKLEYCFKLKNQKQMPNSIL